MFDYEKILYDSLLIPHNQNPLNHAFKSKHLWIEKATGLGVTEFFLRLMAWLSLKDNSYKNSLRRDTAIIFKVNIFDEKE